GAHSSTKHPAVGLRGQSRRRGGPFGGLSAGLPGGGKGHRCRADPVRKLVERRLDGLRQKNMRITTNEFLLGSLPDLLTQESNANQLNREIASGQTMLDSTSDPAGAGQALEVAGQVNQLSYDSSNAQSGAQAIQNGLSALQQVATLIDQLRQTAVQGGNAGNTPAARQALV